MLYNVGLFVSLMILWTMLSWHAEPLLLFLGGASSLLTVVLLARGRFVDREAMPYDIVGRAVVYWAWLLKEIVKANLTVARVILHPSLPISPTVVRVWASQPTRLGRAIYANSITLTPGTIAVALNDGDILVHGLTRSAALGLADGDMDRRAAWVDGEK